MKLEKTPFLATHVNGDVAWIDVLFIPEDHRRQGVGSRILHEWLQRLPETIKKIQLLAVELDGGSPVGFWRKMGFEVEEMYFPELMNGCYMVQKRGEAPQEPAPKAPETAMPRRSDENWCAPA